MGCGSSTEAAPATQNKAPEKKPEEVKPSETKDDAHTEAQAPSQPKEEPKEESSSASQPDESREEMEKVDVVAAVVEAVVHAAFDHQMGGHEGSFHKVDESKIMKRAGDAERAFYETLKDHPEIEQFAPSFHGIQEKDGHKYIVIEDLTAPFKNPCILDIKIGRQSFGEDASPEKREAMEAKDKSSTTHPLGLRITAMKVFQNENGEYIKKSKADGQKITSDDFQSALQSYFHNGKALRKDVLPLFMEKLQKVVEWAEQNAKHRFYSSSLLFIYDGEESSDTPTVHLKMIDFAHVHKIEDSGKDDGYIFGVNNLTTYLKNIHESA